MSVNSLSDNFLNVISWNCCGLDSIANDNKILSKIAKDTSADIITLIESSNDGACIASLLSQSGISYTYINSSTGDGDIKVFAKSQCVVGKKSSNERWCSIAYTDAQGFISQMYFVHLPAKNSSNEVTRHFRNSKIADEIRKDIKDCNCKYSFVVGDFNENPYESTLNSHRCFNALFPSLKTRAFTMTKFSKPYELKTLCATDYFINPSWDLFSNNPEASGTFYYKNATIDCLGWHVLDQLIMSVPAYDSIYKKKSLRVVSSITSTSFLKNGVPNKKYSDHLPIFFNINK